MHEYVNNIATGTTSSNNNNNNNYCSINNTTVTMLHRSKGNSAIIDLPMKDNEAYATLHATYYVKTLPNEAYGILVL